MQILSVGIKDYQASFLKRALDDEEQTHGLVDQKCFYKHEMMLCKLLTELNTSPAQEPPNNPSVLFSAVVEKSIDYGVNVV